MTFKHQMHMYTIKHSNGAYALVLAMTEHDAIEELGWDLSQCQVINAVPRRAKIVDREEGSGSFPKTSATDSIAN